MLKYIIIGFIGLVAASVSFFGIKYRSTIKKYLTFEIIDGQEGIYYIKGFGGNSGLIVGDNAAILIDTKMGKGSKKLKKIVLSKIGNKKLFVVNTHYHPDHVGGNKLFEINEIIAGNYGESFWLEINKPNTLPTQWLDKEKTIDLGGSKVTIMPVGQNHTKNDLFVYSNKHKVLFTGDIYVHETHPVIMFESKPDIVKWENTLRNYALGDLEIDLVVPGHGNLAKQNDLIYLADYFKYFKSKDLKELKLMYKSWDATPFLASIKKSWKLLRTSEIQP